MYILRLYFFSSKYFSMMVVNWCLARWHHAGNVEGCIDQARWKRFYKGWFFKDSRQVCCYYVYNFATVGWSDFEGIKLPWTSVYFRLFLKYHWGPEKKVSTTSCVLQQSISSNIPKPQSFIIRGKIMQKFINMLKLYCQLSRLYMSLLKNLAQ